MNEGRTDLFVYGPYTEPKFRKALFDHPVPGIDAVIGGHFLAVQTLEQVPGSARSLIEPHYTKFEAYTLREGRGLVWGNLITLDESELEIFKMFDLVEEGWYGLKEAEVYTPKGELVRVITDMILSEQPIDRVIEDRVYKPFLNDKQETFKNAEAVNRYYKSLHS